MLDIIVPVYNENRGILKLFKEIRKEIKTSKRVLIVYDFEEDTTLPVILAERENYPFDIILVKNNIGRGALNAIKVGMQDRKSVV